jgi:hypothetical protein
LVGVQSALLVFGGAALAVGENRHSCVPREVPLQTGAAPAESTALQPGPAGSEFAVQYLKGKRGFGRKMDGVLVFVDDSVCFRNRRGDRAFTIQLESAEAQLTTKVKQRIGCWVGLSALISTGLFDPEQQCRRTEYLVKVEVAAPDGPERVIFKPTEAEASNLVAAINHRSARDEVRTSPN